jgi:hypothetical protein
MGEKVRDIHIIYVHNQLSFHPRPFCFEECFHPRVLPYTKLFSKSLARLPLHVGGHALRFETHKIDLTIVIKTYGNFCIVINLGALPRVMRYLRTT